MAALDDRLEVALQIATEAGVLALNRRPAPGAPAATLKGIQDWVTDTDAAIERYISERLITAFPCDGFQGEETGSLRMGNLRWIVDPIDGTANYARGGARFCISIGLVDGRTPVLGVLVAPALGDTFTARLGGGAHLNGCHIHAATTTDLTRATVEISWSSRRPNAAYIALMDRVLAQGVTPRIGGSGALGLADVAAGRLDAYVELHINLWDAAASLALLSEAGAIVSPFMDGIGPTKGDHILAAAPGVAGALCSVAAFE